MKKIRMSPDSLRLYSRQPANAWEEAYPLGGGSLGAVVFGGVHQDRVCLNHDTLWTGYPRNKEFRGTHEAYEQAKALLKAGRYGEAEDTLRDGFSSYGSEAYMPLGDLTVTYRTAGKETGYKRTLHLEDATHRVRFRLGNRTVTRDSFVSHPDNVFVYTIRSDGGAIGFDITLSSLLMAGVYDEGNRLLLEGECPLNAQQNRALTSRTAYYDRHRHGMRFLCAVEVKTNGTVAHKGDHLEVRGASYAHLYVCAETSFNGYKKDPDKQGKDYATLCNARLAAVMADDPDSLYARHVADYTHYFDRLALHLGTAHKEHIPTVQRLEDYAQGEADPALPALLANYGRYLTIAASREGSQAMNLQGIWNHRFLPPWQSNYTVNINTEMNYFPTLAANLSEMHRPLQKLVEELADAGTDTARTLYNAPGWVCHHNTDLWRHSQPVAGDVLYSFWNAGSGWLCHSLFDYYEYTLDRAYLRRIYPILREAADFYLSQLETLPDGTRGVFPSTSPENTFHHEGREIALAETTEMTMGIVRELFRHLLEAARLLKKDDPTVRWVKEELPHLYGPVIAPDGRLAEWYGQRDEVDVHHRHVSHLYALHPGSEITPDGTPALAAACRQTLETRGDDGTGWSLAWKCCFWARLHDGNRAMALVRRQLSPCPADTVEHGWLSGSYANLLCAHPPFQIDGNFGVLAGMLDMLVQSTRDSLHLLPALPDEWTDIAVSGLCAKGKRQIDLTAEGGQLTACVIHGTLPAKVLLRGEDITNRFEKTKDGYQLV